MRAERPDLTRPDRPMGGSAGSFFEAQLGVRSLPQLDAALVPCRQGKEISMSQPFTPPRWQIMLVREKPAPSFPATTIRTSRDIADAFDFLTHADREQFWVTALNGKNRITGTHQVSVGTLTASLVHPREVLKVLILSSAAACILIHNHPSGDPTPSAEDMAITQRLSEVGALVGIRILDHVILGDGRYVSFGDEGLLPG